MKRAPAAALATLLVLAGCTDLGLEGNIPLEEARHEPPADLVAAVHGRASAEDGDVVMAGRLWVPWGLPVDGELMDLRPVGSVHGVTLYARSWDRPPFDALFARQGVQWQGHAPVFTGTGANRYRD